jgi:glycosyltransferase involved in cell wall biosynthesis
MTDLNGGEERHAAEAPTSPVDGSASTADVRFLILNWRDWTHPKAGGSENFLRVISTGLVRRGYSVTLIAQDYSGGPSRDSLDGVEVIRAGNQVTGYLRALAILGREAGSRRSTVVIESINTIPFLSRIQEIPHLVIIPHIAAAELFSEIPFPLSAGLYVLERAGPVLMRNQYVVTTCQQSKGEMLAVGYSPDMVRVVPPGVDTERFRPVDRGSKPSLELCYVGPLKRYKGVERALEGFRSLLRRFPTAKFHIAGRGYLEPSLRAFVDREGLSKSVIFHGYISEEQKVDLFRRCSLFTSLSASEGGWSLATLEAMASGLPVVASSALAEMVGEGRGVVVNPQNSEEFVRAVTGYWSDAATWLGASTTSARWASEFSLELTVDRFCSVVSEVTSLHIDGKTAIKPVVS